MSRRGRGEQQGRLVIHLLAKPAVDRRERAGVPGRHGIDDGTALAIIGDPDAASGHRRPFGDGSSLRVYLRPKTWSLSEHLHERRSHTVNFP